MQVLSLLACVLALGALVLGRLLPPKGNPTPLANRLAYQLGSGAGAVLLALLAVLAPGLTKGVALAVGSVAGLILAWLVEFYEWPEQAAAGARVGALVVVLVIFTLIWPDPVVLSYAVGGLAAALSACHLFAVFYNQDNIGTGGLMGVSLMAMGALAWLPRIWHAGTPAQPAFLTAMAAGGLGLAAAGWAWPERPVAAPIAAGAGALLVAAAVSRYAGVHVPGGMMLPVIIGVAASLAFALTPAQSRGQGLGSVIPTMLAISGAVLALRLGGMNGLAFFGLGLLGILGIAPTTWGTALLTVVGTRMGLQLWLSRTDLTELGIDLTHPYAYIGLVGGCFFAVLVAMLHQRFQARRIVLLPLGWGVLCLPLLTGFLLHVEPLGAFIVSLSVLCLVWGLLRQGAETNRLADLAAPLTGVAMTTGLLTASWLVDMINAPRALRAGVLVGALALVILYMVGALKRMPAMTSVIDTD